MKGRMGVPRWLAVSLALFVTLLWSSSYILNKMAFAEGIRPLTLAGLRYSLAALTLLAVRVRRGTRGTRKLALVRYVGLGVAGYVIGQGMQYIGQYYISPTQASLVLSVGNTLLVLLVGALWLGERPGAVQGLGIAVALGGALTYYYPWTLRPEHWLGVALILLSSVGYATQLTANRRLLGGDTPADPFDLVLLPMAVGAVGMLALGLILEPWPVISAKLVLLLLWLGPVNGALAFLLWTYSQKALKAYESSNINNSMLVQIAALDVIFLHREINGRALAGVLASAVGVATVQLQAIRGRRAK